MLPFKCLTKESMKILGPISRNFNSFHNYRRLYNFYRYGFTKTKERTRGNFRLANLILNSMQKKKLKKNKNPARMIFFWGRTNSQILKMMMLVQKEFMNSNDV